MSLKEKVVDILKGNNKEIFNYLVFGVLTTLVNYVSYFGATRWLQINYIVANIIAWFISVVFAYVTNKFWVFEDKSLEIKKLVKEVFMFFAARVMSGGVETLMLFVLMTLFGLLVHVTSMFHLVCLILFLSGLQMLFVAILGQYTTKDYMESKQRPIYIVKETSKNLS